MSWLPVISQLKSLVQVCTGDGEGARQTQVEFLRQCPVVSQGTSFVYWVKGDNKEAENIQVECLKTIGGVVDGLPVVGHVKGVVHYACGDYDGGHQAMKSSSRSSAIFVGGAIGGVLGGPGGAFAGGLAGAGLVDSAATAIESGTKGEFKPNGYYLLGKELYDDIAKKEYHKIGGHVFDTGLTVTMDGFAGRAAYKATAVFTPEELNFFEGLEDMQEILDSEKSHPIPPPQTTSLPSQSSNNTPSSSSENSTTPPDTTPNQVPDSSTPVTEVPDNFNPARRASAPELHKTPKSYIKLQKAKHMSIQDFTYGFDPHSPGAWSVFYHMVRCKVLILKARIVAMALRVRKGQMIDAAHFNQILDSIRGLERTNPNIAANLTNVANGIIEVAKQNGTYHSA